MWWITNLSHLDSELCQLHAVSPVKRPPYAFFLKSVFSWKRTGSQVNHTNLHCAHIQVSELESILFGYYRIASLSQRNLQSVQRTTPSILGPSIQMICSLKSTEIPLGCYRHLLAKRAELLQLSEWWLMFKPLQLQAEYELLATRYEVLVALNRPKTLFSFFFYSVLYMNSEWEMTIGEYIISDIMRYWFDQHIKRIREKSCCLPFW